MLSLRNWTRRIVRPTVGRPYRSGGVDVAPFGDPLLAQRRATHLWFRAGPGGVVEPRRRLALPPSPQKKFDLSERPQQIWA